MQKKIVILFLLFFSCNSFDEDSKGKFNEIVIVSSDEDRDILEPIINDYIIDTIYTPEPELEYQKIWISPDNFSYYQDYSNIFIVSLKDPIDQSLDFIIEEFKNSNKIKKFPAIVRDVYSKPQIITFIQNSNSLELTNSLDSLSSTINFLIDNHIDSLYLYRYNKIEKNSDIINLSSKIFDNKLLVDKTFKIIDYDSLNKFLWLGKGSVGMSSSSYQWIFLNEKNRVTINGNLDLSRLIERQLLEFDPQIQIISNKDRYQKTEYENFRIYKVYTNYNHKTYKTGGAMVIYVIDDFINNKNIIFYGLVNAPGQNKLKYIKELETIIINFIF